MPPAAQTQSVRGWVGPAPTPHSPVARAYPSLRFSLFSQFDVRLTVLSRNNEERAVSPTKSHVFYIHKLFTIMTIVNK